MSETLAASPAHGILRYSFYFWMTLLMAFLVFAGFGMSYWFPLARGTFPPAPPIVHLHGLVFSSWMILLVVQATLVNTGNMRLHRSFGTWGIAHATAVLFTGALISLVSTAHSLAPLTENPGGLDAVYLSFTAVLGFGLLFTLSIRNVRRPDIHKRLMLFAMLPILPPGVNRFYMVPFGLDSIPVVPLYLTLIAMALAILIHEWRGAAKIGRYSMVGAGWIVLQAVLHVPVTASDSFFDLCKVMASLVQYR